MHASSKCHKIAGALTLFVLLLAQLAHAAGPIVDKAAAQLDERAAQGRTALAIRQTLASGRGAALSTSSTTSTRATTTSRRLTTTTRRTTTTSTTRRTTTTAPRTSTTSKTSTSSSPAASSTGGTGSGTGSAFATNILQAHNSARSPRHANALTWSTSAADYAKTWGEKCVWQHGGNPNMGQNLAASAGYKQSGQQVVDAWMSEEKDYDPNNPTYSHFTQVVWKSTTQVGCYQAVCTKLVNPDGSETFPGYSPAYFTVCNYVPPGNYQGQYAQNVEKLNS